MANFSLSSAIVGAFITAAFAYLVRLILLRKSEKKRQERLALLYLTRITEIVAWKQAIEFTYKEIISQIQDKIRDDETGYILHRICVKVSEAFHNRSESSDLISDPEISRFIDVAKSWSNQDQYFGYKIDDELLSNLPTEAIIQYHFFINRISQINTTLLSWISAFESNNFSLLDPNSLFHQILGFKKLVDSADSLRSSLITKAKIRRKKAADILAQQFKYYATELVTFEKDKKIIEIFKEVGEKAQKEGENAEVPENQTLKQ